MLNAVGRSVSNLSTWPGLQAIFEKKKKKGRLRDAKRVGEKDARATKRDRQWRWSTVCEETETRNNHEKFFL